MEIKEIVNHYVNFTNDILEVSFRTIDDDDTESYASLKAKLDAGFNLWVNHRSFFFSVEGRAQFDFSEHKYRLKSLVQGKIVDFDLKFIELKVF